MKTYTSFSHSYHSPSPCVVALGCFDGVHEGHRAVIRRAKEEAQRLGCPLAVWTFDLPPKNYFVPDSVPFITDGRAKREQMRRLGVDILFCLPFEETIGSMTAQDFFSAVLQEQLCACHVVCGFNYTFGAGGTGNVALLDTLCKQAGIGLTALSPVTVQGVIVSSSAVRQAVAAGDTEEARRLLGRPYALRTIVIDGQKLGRQLGFPTVNQCFPKGMLVPHRGVYAVRVTLQGRKKHWYGIANVGIRPTVGGETLGCETNIFEFEGDLYGKWVQVEFLRFLREEIAFDTVDSLAEQVHRDIVSVREMIANHLLDC